eukprot:COSAG05_NODE_6264_length_987_cov_1.930259_1_plen_223_part_00
MGLPIKQIKTILESAGVDYADCSERSELEARLAELRAGTAKTRPQRRSSGAGGATPGGGSAPPARPKASSTPAGQLGRNPDGTDGGETGSLIRRVCKSDCYYAVLGVGKKSDGTALKKAYRKLALKMHPDKCNLTGAEEAFKKVSSAFACLSDPQKRSGYDMWGSENGPAGMGGGGGGGGGFWWGGGGGRGGEEGEDAAGLVKVGGLRATGESGNVWFVVSV